MLNDGYWHHFDIVYKYDTLNSINNIFKVYIDDQLLGQTTSNSTGALLDSFNNNPFVTHIGALAGSVFTGKLDNIRIWDKALSEQELINYNSCLPGGNESNLFAFWNFENNNDTIIYDISPNQHFGYINNLSNYINDPAVLNCNLINTQGCDSTLILNIIFDICGCTDPLAFNYNANATSDDGSCVYVVLGCKDSTQFNYEPLANTDDGSCVPFIYGCIDSTQFNFSPLANTDDGSCIPFIYGCTDSTQFNYNPLANTYDGSCIPFIYGCTDSLACNFIRSKYG